MRKTMWATLLLGLALATPARNQTSLFGGIDPTKLFYSPVDTSKTAVPVASPQTNGFTSFKLSNVFPNHSFSLGPSSTIGSSRYPTMAQMPGQGWLDAFHYQRPSREKRR